METAAAAAPATKKRRTEAHHEGRESMEVLSPAQTSRSRRRMRPIPGLHLGRNRKDPTANGPPRGAGAGKKMTASTASASSPTPSSATSSPFLPTKDAVRTRTLASRWRGIWRSAPLNLDFSSRSFKREEEVQAYVISQILAAHPGPARRFSVPVRHLKHRPAAADAWLRSPALNGLQELEFHTRSSRIHFTSPKVPLPVSALRFSDTLRVVAISKCHFPESAVEVLRFPQLRQLELQRVEISDGSLNSIISGSPVLECLLLDSYYGCHSIRINSPSLVSIGLSIGSGNLVIEDAPSLERLLQLEYHVQGLQAHILVISAPKLETLGCLYSRDYDTKYTFGTTVLQVARPFCLLAFTRRAIAFSYA
ncbi:hypothetical protein PR202_ga17651 [Eleusine coracana subsp. coracana]|uniref:F-box/LRR-repeat protein 15/At3g58940/PEG3-like LRR domain-containing protein n=1 Tax=Eleusine coracana subsp. coracana TaxID=191504 RepID=A0AAV5CPM4_ELECO|nr:hypothetical protein PR202_ga17404 [Eleusine coracana subsp. coracana]GJN00467.1 hypothetical protein PR202_ga17651 [Eleusine coracana subsp. coracana]